MNSGVNSEVAVGFLLVINNKKLGAWYIGTLCKS